MDKVIEIEGLCKTFKTDKDEVAALNGVNLSVERGEVVGVIGFSGAGKSTLVRCINALERPSSGHVCVAGEDVSTLSGKELLQLRRRIGMIFQNFNLMQQKTVLKNVLFPLEVAGVKRAAARERALELLNEVGLADKATAYPAQLSGGQKQRVAIARALALNPDVLICDEATSALDPETTAQILALLKEINEKYSLTIVVISHQLNVVKSLCSRIAVLDDGVICEEGDTEELFKNPQSDAARRLFAYEGGIL
ncbi:MAG: methionine ABC transporter ATP-binding protein [Bacteroides sp.]|nr:methionine ABC transporter ATP-binding protein [Bacillota bacterium]MCM1393463.1 methionine ABC transporter ATP-binding protein [[Eubacterium] siraeum]MCM1455303.1 methionine ABC transporter ATP-binding protein [Bacteroides sp.]